MHAARWRGGRRSEYWQDNQIRLITPYLTVYYSYVRESRNWMFGDCIPFPYHDYAAHVVQSGNIAGFLFTQNRSPTLWTPLPYE